MIVSIALKILNTKKREIVRTVLSCSITITLTLLFTGFLFSHRFIGKSVPMLIAITPTSENRLIENHGSMDDVVLNGLEKNWSSKVNFWPFAYYNIQYMYVKMALNKLYLSVIIVPDNFPQEKLSDVLARGRFPNKSSLECIVGSDSARAWNFDLEKHIGLTLGEKITNFRKNADSDSGNVITIVGLLSDKVASQFLRGSIIITQSTYETLVGSQPIYNGVLVYASPFQAPVNEIIREMKEIGFKILQNRFPLISGGPLAMMMLICFLGCGVLFQMNGTSILNSHFNMVGILKSMGAGNFILVTLFASIDFLVQTLVVLVGYLGAKLTLLFLNSGVMKSGVSAFSGFSTYYRLHTWSIFALACVLAFSVIIRTLRTANTIFRQSPDKLLRRKNGTVL